MLLGKDFGGCHDARLITIVEGDEHCHQRHKGLAGAYVALQKTVHLSSGTHVVTYLVHHTLLRSGEAEGEVLRIEVVEQLAYMLENIAAILATMVGSIAENVELHVEQFFELQTVTRRLHLLRCLGIMYAAHRLIARDEVKRFGDEGGEGFGERVLQFEKHVLHRLLYHSRRDAHLLHALRGGVVWLHAHLGELKVRGSFHLGMGKLEASLIDGWTTEDYELLPYLIVLIYILCPTEPYEVGYAGAVAEMTDHSLLTRRHLELLVAEHLALYLHEGHIGGKLTNGIDTTAVDILIRKILDKVTPCGYPKLLAQDFLTLGAHTGQIHYVLREYIHIGI